MSETKPTPGPFIKWRLAPDSDPQERCIITTEDGETEICGIVYQEKDADLFSAALDLLEACSALEAAETAWANCPDCDGEANPPESCGTCFPAFDDARLKRRAAISKAGGRQ